jgi:hypothetical protein
MNRTELKLNCLGILFIYIAEGQTSTSSKHISRDRYPMNLLARQSDLQKEHRLPLLPMSRVVGVWDVTAETQRSCNPYLLLRNPSIHRAVA